MPSKFDIIKHALDNDENRAPGNTAADARTALDALESAGYTVTKPPPPPKSPLDLALRHGPAMAWEWRDGATGGVVLVRANGNRMGPADEMLAAAELDPEQMRELARRLLNTAAEMADRARRIELAEEQRGLGR